MAIIILAWYHMTGILMDIYENWSIERTLKGRFVDSVEIAQQNTGGAYDDSNACTVLSRMVAFDMTFVDAQEYLRANFGRALNDGVLMTLYHETLDCLYERGDVVNGKYFTSSISLPKNDKGDNLRVKDYLNKEGTYLLSINGHAICVKDGVLYDSGDMFNTYNTPVRLENKVEDFDILAFIDPENTPKIAFDDDAYTEPLIAKIKDAVGDRDGSQTVYVSFSRDEAELKRQFNGVCGNIKGVFDSIEFCTGR